MDEGIDTSTNKKVEKTKTRPDTASNADTGINTKLKNKGKRSKVASRFMDESQHSDLIFNLDFY